MRGRMGFLKRPERVEGVGWRLLNQVLGPRSSQASAFYQVEAYTIDAKSSKQLDTHSLHNDEQNMGHQGIFCDRAFKSCVGGLVGNHTSPYCGQGNTLLPGPIPFSSHADTFLFCSKRSCWRRAFATQSNHRNDDNLDSSSYSSSFEMDAMDSLCSEDDSSDKEYNSKTFRRGCSARSDGSLNALYREEEMSLSDGEAMDSHYCDTDRSEKKNASKRGRPRSYARAIAKQGEKEDNVDLDDEDELQRSSLLDLACDTVNADSGDKTRPLWLRVEEFAGKGMSALHDVLETWLNEGYPLDRVVIVFTITVLRKRKKYQRALQLSDWVMMEKPFELNDMDYGIRVELLGKLKGVREAAEYFRTIPKQFQTSMAYSLLLTVYVDHNQEKDALSLINKVDTIGLEHRTYMYNQLLQLYKKKGSIVGVAEVLQNMDKKDVVPDIYTYNTILDLRARKGDTDGMEKVWNQIKEDENVVPDAVTFSILAKGYINARLYDKAEKVVKKLEASPLRRQRAVTILLIKFYGQLGKEEDIDRVWSLVAGPRMPDYTAMIRALGKIGNVNRAEKIFKEMAEKMDSFNVHQYNALLSVYANKGSTKKGEILLKHIERVSVSPNAKTYHELVLMYLKAAEEEKAMRVVEKVWKGHGSLQIRPMYDTFHALLEWFARKGDVQNAEIVMKDLKMAGYMGVFRSYATLLKAYTNAGKPPYGFLDRVRGDNLIPNQLIRRKVQELGGT